MQPRVDRHRLTFVLLAWLGGATVCFAQDVARMDQVVQSYVSNGIFAGSVLVARGSDLIVSKGYEPHLVPATLDARFFADLPTRLIGDRGYDSDRLDDTLMTTYGIEMIAAHRRGRARTQDGRPLRRVRRRWKVERFFAWLHHSRRAVTRWEYHVDNFLGMIQLACARMLLRAFMR
jgi:transposase